MRSFVVAIAVIASIACSDAAGTKANAGSTADAGSDGTSFANGAELRIAVPDQGRVFVKLSPPSIVSPTGDPKTSLDWDLAFEGLDVFTNSGVSGSGRGAAFGPLDAVTFIGDEAPYVPFLNEDKAGGAFLDWYAYEDSTHALWRAATTCTASEMARARGRCRRSGITASATAPPFRRSTRSGTRS